MRKMIFPAVAAALISASTLAFAASATDTSTIKSIDAKAPSITLDDGKVFKLAKSFNVTSLKVGAKVTVTYDMKGTDMVATKVAAAK
jgi:Cu/Ag efflux protein CusF